MTVLGMIGAPPAAQPVSFRSQVGKTGVRSINVAANGGQPGDLCVLVGTAKEATGGSAPSSANPSGWQKLDGGAFGVESTLQSTTYMSLVAFWRRLTGSEGAVNLFDSNWDKYCIRMLLFRDADPITTVDSDFGANDSGKTLGLSGGTAPIVVVGGFAAALGAGISSVTFEGGADGSYENSDGNVRLQVRWRLDASAQNTEIAHGMDLHRRYLGVGISA